MNWDYVRKCLVDQNGIPLQKSEVREFLKLANKHLSIPESELANMANDILEQDHPQMAKVKWYSPKEFR